MLFRSSNAIRYSADNSVINLEAAVNERKVVFSIKDQGAGIDKQYLERVFERYFQVPGSDASGTGLGLAISKEFIEGQNGKIWAESEVGEGSKFCFTLACV